MTSRRVFIKSGAAAMLSLGFAPDFLASAAAAAQSRRKLLIAIFQRGAVDGLNMVVPFGDVGYAVNRPAIAIAPPGSPSGAVDLDGFFGLHPRMAPLQRFWKDGTLAVVHACGSPDATRSHFDAQDYMESATPGVKSTRDGWLNRTLQAIGPESPLQGIALTRQAPRSLSGQAATLSFPAVDSFTLRSGADAEARYARSQDALLSGSARDAFEAMRVLGAATRGDYRPSAGAEYPATPFGRALQDIARIAKADIGLEVAFAESTNWDHHVNEGGAEGQMAARLDDFSRGIAALALDLGDRLGDTVILTMSEFGRTVAQNGNGGTDHGHGNAMLLLGGPVNGGKVHGRWPGLAATNRHDGRDLAVTTDFRDVFAAVASRHLAVPQAALAKVLPNHTVRAVPELLRG